MRPTVSTGSESTSSQATIIVIQTKTGRRNIVIPGARRLMMVTMKFSEAIRDEVPRMISDTV